MALRLIEPASYRSEPSFAEQAREYMDELRDAAIDARANEIITDAHALYRAIDCHGIDTLSVRTVWHLAVEFARLDGQCPNADDSADRALRHLMTELREGVVARVAAEDIDEEVM